MIIFLFISRGVLPDTYVSQKCPFKNIGQVEKLHWSTLQFQSEWGWGIKQLQTIFVNQSWLKGDLPGSSAESSNKIK